MLQIVYILDRAFRIDPPAPICQQPLRRKHDRAFTETLSRQVDDYVSGAVASCHHDRERPVPGLIHYKHEVDGVFVGVAAIHSKDGPSRQCEYFAVDKPFHVKPRFHAHRGYEGSIPHSPPDGIKEVSVYVINLR